MSTEYLSYIITINKKVPWLISSSSHSYTIFLLCLRKNPDGFKSMYVCNFHVIHKNILNVAMREIKMCLVTSCKGNLAVVITKSCAFVFDELSGIKNGTLGNVGESTLNISQN